MAAGRRKSPGKKKKARGRKRATRRIPSPSTVVDTFDLESPAGRKYRVRRTTQTDPYDSTSDPGSGKKR